jgi:hypothetical protein
MVICFFIFLQLLLQRFRPSNFCTVHGGTRERQLVRKGGCVSPFILVDE